MATLGNAIGHTLRNIRVAKGMTLRQVSLNVSLGYVSDIERGIKNPSPEVLEQLADNLHITMPEFLREVAGYIEGRTP